jgi:hypothetical protein
MAIVARAFKHFRVRIRLHQSRTSAESSADDF